MSHSSISATRDSQHVADKGELINPEQSAGFVSDPMLTPITASSAPHPIHPDPTPSSDPSAFDPSTRHPNTHYHHEKQLSKKKRAKKLGVGAYVAHPGGVNAGGRSFAEHDKAAHERAEKRDHDLAQEAEGSKGEYEDEEDEEQAAVSHNQHHENRVTGSEQSRGGAAPADAKPRSASTADKGDKAGDDSTPAEGGSTSMKEKVSGVLASAQEKASGMMEAVKQQPMVSSLLSKVGLGGAKTAEDSTKEDNAQGKKEEEA